MPTNVGFQVPFIPQEGITQQILAAIQLANQQHFQQQQIGVQQQQVGVEQQRLQQQAPYVAAQTENIRSQISAGLPAAEAARDKALAEQTAAQTAFEKETNPISKSILEQTLREKTIQADRANLLYRMMTSASGPAAFNDRIDSIVPPTGDTAELNKRTKEKVALAMQFGDIEGARKEVDNASNFINEMSKEKYVQGREDMRAALSRQMSHANTIQAHALDEVDKLWTDPQHGFVQFLAQANATKGAIQKSADGNELASNLVPLMTVLGVNSFAGIHRINPVEYAAAGREVGSIYRQINAVLDKVGSGSVPPETLKEMDSLIDGLIQSKHDSLIPATKLLVSNSGLDEKQIMVMGKDGKPEPLAGTGKVSATAPIAPPRPAGVPPEAVWHPETRTWSLPNAQ